MSVAAAPAAATTDEHAPVLSRVARGGTFAIGGTGAAAVLGFVLTLVVTHGLTTSSAGQFFSATAVFLVLQTFLSFGVGAGVVRFIPRLRAQDRVADVPALLAVALVPVVGLGLVGTGALWAAGPLLARKVGHSDPSATLQSLHVLAVFLLVGVVQTAVVECTRGFASIRSYVLTQQIFLPLSRPVLVLVAVALGAPLWGVVLAWSAPMVPAVVMALAVVARSLRADFGSARAWPARSRPLGEIAREYWAFTGPRGISSIMEILLTWLDVLIVAAIVSASQAAIYAAASRFVTSGTLVLQALRLVISPELSASLTRRDRGRVDALYSSVTQWVVVTSWPIYLIMAVFSPAVLRLFGPSYVDGATALSVLSAAMLVFLAAGNVGTILLMGGKSTWVLADKTLVLGLNVVGNVTLTPRYGITGAAVAWAVTIVVDSALAWIQVRRGMGIRARSGTVSEAAGWSLACFAVVPLLVRWTWGTSWPAVATGSALAVLAYAAVIARRPGHLGLPTLLRALRPGRSRPADAPAARQDSAGAAKSGRPFLDSTSSPPAINGYRSERTRPVAATFSSARPTATVGGFFRMLGRRWISLGVCVVLGLIVGAGMYVALPKHYTATAVVDITPATGSNIDPKTISTATQENVVTSTSVASQAAGLLGRSGTGSSLAANVSVTSPLNSLLLDIAYTSTSQAGAADGANAFANAYLAYSTGVAKAAVDQTSATINGQISALNTQLDQLATSAKTGGADNASQIASLQSRISDLESKLQANQQTVVSAGRIVGEANAADAKASKTRLLYPLAGLLGGLIVGIVVAAIKDRRDDSVRGVDDLAEAAGGPTFAVVPALPSGIGPAGSAVAPDDAYRRLATKLRAHAQGQMGVLVVDAGGSSSPTTPATLAAAFAKSGQVTVLAAIRPGIETGARALSVTPPPLGLEGTLVERLVRVGTVNRLFMLDLGDEDELGAAMTGAAGELTQLQRLADVVVVDAVNLSYPSSVLTLTSMAPQAVLLARHKTTTRSQVANAGEELSQVGVDSFGAVLVVPTRDPGSRGRGAIGSGRGTRSALRTGGAHAEVTASGRPVRELPTGPIPRLPADEPVRSAHAAPEPADALPEPASASQPAADGTTSDPAEQPLHGTEVSDDDSTGPVSLAGTDAGAGFAEPSYFPAPAGYDAGSEFDAPSAIDDLSEFDAPSDIDARAEFEPSSEFPTRAASDAAADLDPAEFNGPADHDQAEFNRPADHDLAEFNRPADRDVAEFSAPADHDATEFSRPGEFSAPADDTPSDPSTAADPEAAAVVPAGPVTDPDVASDLDPAADPEPEDVPSNEAAGWQDEASGAEDLSPRATPIDRDEPLLDDHLVTITEPHDEPESPRRESRAIRRTTTSGRSVQVRTVRNRAGEPGSRPVVRLRSAGRPATQTRIVPPASTRNPAGETPQLGDDHPAAGPSAETDALDPTATTEPTATIEPAGTADGEHTVASDADYPTVGSDEPADPEYGTPAAHAEYAGAGEPAEHTGDGGYDTDHGTEVHADVSTEHDEHPLGADGDGGPSHDTGVDTGIFADTEPADTAPAVTDEHADDPEQSDPEHPDDAEDGSHNAEAGHPAQAVHDHDDHHETGHDGHDGHHETDHDGHHDVETDHDDHHVETDHDDHHDHTVTAAHADGRD